MNSRLCIYEELTPRQCEQLRDIQVHPEQMAFCGDIASALHFLPRHTHPAIKGMVLLSDERPVAFLLLKRQPLLAHWADADSATLHALQVDKRVQGQGLGKACLNALPQMLQHLWPEIRQVMLSVSVFNTGALTFYLSQGWIEDGEAYRGERRLVLRLNDCAALDLALPQAV